MTSNYEIRMDILRKKREELSLRRYEIEQRIAKRDATMVEYKSKYLHSTKQQLESIKKVTEIAKKRNDELIQSIHIIKVNLNGKQTFTEESNNRITTSTAQLKYEKARYLQKIQAIYPGWQENAQHYRLQKLHRLEDKKRKVEQRRANAEKMYEKQQYIDDLIRQTSHEIHLAENLEKNEILERLVIKKARDNQAKKIGQNIKEHAIEARYLLSSAVKKQGLDASGINLTISENIHNVFSPHRAVQELEQMKSTLSSSPCEFRQKEAEDLEINSPEHHSDKPIQNNLVSESPHSPVLVSVHLHRATKDHNLTCEEISTNKDVSSYQQLITEPDKNISSHLQPAKVVAHSDQIHKSTLIGRQDKAENPTTCALDLYTGGGGEETELIDSPIDILADKTRTNNTEIIFDQLEMTTLHHHAPLGRSDTNALRFANFSMSSTSNEGSYAQKVGHSYMHEPSATDLELHELECLKTLRNKESSTETNDPAPTRTTDPRSLHRDTLTPASSIEITREIQSVVKSDPADISSATIEIVESADYHGLQHISSSFIYQDKSPDFEDESVSCEIINELDELKKETIDKNITIVSSDLSQHRKVEYESYCRDNLGSEKEEHSVDTGPVSAKKLENLLVKYVTEDVTENYVENVSRSGQVNIAPTTYTDDSQSKDSVVQICKTERSDLEPSILNTTLTQMPCDDETAFIPSTQLSATSNLEHDDILKVLGVLIPRIEESAREGETFSNVGVKAISCGSKKEIVRMSLGNRKSLVGYESIEACFDLMLDICSELGPVLFPHKAFEGIMNEQRLYKIYQHSKCKELELWNAISSHIKNLSNAHVIPSAGLVEMFVSAFLKHDLEDKRSQRKLKEFLSILCGGTESSTMHSEIKPDNVEESAIDAKTSDSRLSNDMRNLALGSQSKHTASAPLLLQTALLQQPKIATSTTTLNFRLGSTRHNKLNDTAISKSLVKSPSKLSEQLIRGVRLSDCDEFDDDQVDYQNLIGSSTGHSTQVQKVSMDKDANSKCTADDVFKQSLNVTSSQAQNGDVNAFDMDF